MTVKKVLEGHISPETAYFVTSYPYGRKLRCNIRYWIEYKAGYGCRCLSQTTNPKAGNRWNKPHAGTYSRFGAAMYLDEIDHVQFAGLSEYSDGKEARAFVEQFARGVPEGEAREVMFKWLAAKEAYELARKDREDAPLELGTREAAIAWITTNPIPRGDE